MGYLVVDEFQYNDPHPIWLSGNYEQEVART